MKARHLIHSALPLCTLQHEQQHTQPLCRLSPPARPPPHNTAMHHHHCASRCHPAAASCSYDSHERLLPPCLSWRRRLYYLLARGSIPGPRWPPHRPRGANFTQGDDHLPSLPLIHLHCSLPSVRRRYSPLLSSPIALILFSSLLFSLLAPWSRSVAPAA